MIVIMPGVAVGSDYDLKAIAPQLSGKGDTNAVCRICVHFICLKGLITVITGPAALIMHQPLCLHELLRRRFLAVEIEAGDIGSFLGFHLVGSIFHHTFDFMKLRESFLVMRFLWIAGVIDDLIHPSFNGPD